MRVLACVCSRVCACVAGCVWVCVSVCVHVGVCACVGGCCDPTVTELVRCGVRCVGEKNAIRAVNVCSVLVDVLSKLYVCPVHSDGCIVMTFNRGLALLCENQQL